MLRNISGNVHLCELLSTPGDSFERCIYKCTNLLKGPTREWKLTYFYVSNKSGIKELKLVNNLWVFFAQKAFL